MSRSSLPAPAMMTTTAPRHDSPTAPDAWADRLRSLGLAVREAVMRAREAGADFATPVAHEGGDTIFAIDRHVEPIIEREVERWCEHVGPITLIAEGMGESGVHEFHPSEPARPAPGLRASSEPARPAPASAAAARSGAETARLAETRAWRIIIDPIDGTRGLMYDKRAAWFLAAVAPDHGDATRLHHAIASAIVELPTSKAGLADDFTATRDGPVRGYRRSLSEPAPPEPGLRASSEPARPEPASAAAARSGAETTRLAVGPSRANTLRHGFAQVASFFPGTKVLAAQLMEHIAHATLGPPDPGDAAIYDDQYISTGGQFVELITGRDRFCCDLRPLFYDLLVGEADAPTHATQRGLECHPYDLAGLLVAQRAGVIVTDGRGRELDTPLDVHTGVHWIAYANAQLRRQIEPVILEWFEQRA